MKRQYYLGAIFLIAQFVSIIYARVIPERFFCWAPYDQHTHYELFVEAKGVELTKSEIQERYHYRATGWEPRSIFNVINIVNQYESTYGETDRARVKIKYSINGNSEEIWIKK